MTAVRGLRLAYRQHLASRLIVHLIGMIFLSACAAHTPEYRDNANVRLMIHDSVPGDWRDAVASIQEISPLHVSPELRDFINSTARSNATPRDRVFALARSIIDPDDGIGLSYDPGATYSASEAFASRTANCLGFSNLLVASARELGLDASYELVSHRLRWEKTDGALIGTLHVRVASHVGASKFVLDFYPLPLESGYSTQEISDDTALAHHMNNLAVTSMQGNDHAQAYALIYKAIETSPNVAFIWSNLGILLSRQGLDVFAEMAFDEALSIDPGSLSTLSNLQRLYTEQGRNEEARALSAVLDDYREQNPYYHFWLGEQAYELGEYRAAVEHLKKAIKLNANEREFFLLLSKSYNNLGLDKAASRA